MRDVRYPPISDYAIIGDSRACALVSKAGSIDWLCLPNIDSPSVFGRLLDWERGGHFQIVPAEPYELEREYVGETNVLRTTFRTSAGEAHLIDFMPAETEDEKRGVLGPLRSVFRIVEGRLGSVAMRLVYMARPDYGRGETRIHGRTPHEATAVSGRHVIHLSSDVSLAFTRGDAYADFVVHAGERFRFSLAYSYGEPAIILSDGYVDRIYDRTVAYWKGWSRGCTYRGPYRDQVLRSALALKLLAHAPTGAIAAAATTSLPERIGGERNWDYRLCWIRDASLTVRAFLNIGLLDEAQAFVGWLMHATNQTAPRLNPLYTLRGEPRAAERVLEHFEGYRSSRPVRIGNAAHAQRQFDVYGELIDAYHCFVEDQGAKSSRDEASFVSRIADYVASHWREPDNGIWEPRIGPQQYVHSKIMAWDALRHAAAMRKRGMIRGDGERWHREAEAIRMLVLERGYNARAGAFTQVLDGEDLDAAVLVMPSIGFIDGRDPRMLSTIKAVRGQLGVGGYLMRYTARDGLAPGEGAFLVCNFWLVSALAHAGELDDAHAVFQESLLAMNDVGLLAEEVEPYTLEALGNTPQAFSHLGLIMAALELEEAEARQGFGGATGGAPAVPLSDAPDDRSSREWRHR